MYRPVWAAPTHSHSWNDSWAPLIVPFTICICVAATLRYGYYGDSQMVLGPSSSRLVKASSVFVKHIEVSDNDKKGVFLYGFTDKPELSQEINWTVSKYLVVGSYGRKGFTLWLNKGSTIQMKWEAQTSNLNQLQVVMIKGERKYETLLPKLTSSYQGFNLSEPIMGKHSEYTIEEDDRYYVGVINTNPKSIIMTMNLSVSSTTYDISKAENMCSTIKGSCRLKLIFPYTQYVVVTTPDNGDLGGWYVQLSFVARVITYIAILGFVVIILFVILKYLGACDSDNSRVVDTYSVREVTETDPILPEKPIPFTYGTNEEDPESGSSSSSEDLYDAKLCVICYDENRNCFYVPCGHCATCYDCAQRIMEGDSKVCPICRRYIHKVRKLFNP